MGDRDELGRILLDKLSLKNYEQAFDPNYLPTLFTAVRYATLSTIAGLLIGYPIAYWIARYGGRRKALLLLLVLLPFWTSWLIRTYAWMIILRDNGVVNSLLQATGITSEPVILLGTDFPTIPYPYAHQLEGLARLDLGDEWLRQVCWANGAQLFGLSR